MKKKNPVLFKEQIFYHHGDYSSFLSGTYISIAGITIQKHSSIPDSLIENLAIEFAMPNSDKIIKATAKAQNIEGHTFLKFTEISEQSLLIISNFINSKSDSKNLSLQL